MVTTLASAQFSFGVVAGIDFDTVNNIDAEVAALDKNINIYVGRSGHHFGGFFKIQLPKLVSEGRSAFSEKKPFL